MDNYRRLVYLESTGSQWIDTGVLTNSSYGFELRYQLVSFANQEFFGGGDSWSSGLGICTHGSDRLGYIIGSECHTSTIDYSIHTVLVKQKELYIDGNFITSSSVSSSSTKTMWIFRHSGTNANTCSYKCLYCKLMDENNTVIRNFIPVLWNANTPYIDGNTNQTVVPASAKPGMYDQVSGKLFVNQSTGVDFSYRESLSIHPFERLEYLESTGSQWIDTGITMLGTDLLQVSSTVAITNSNRAALFGIDDGGVGVSLESMNGYLRMLWSNRYDLTSIPVELNNVFSFRYSATDGNQSITVGSTTLNYNKTGRISTDSIRIFGRNRFPDGLLYAKIYSFNLKVNTTELDFIPVLWHAGHPYTDGNTNQRVTPSSDKPGMYDTVSKKLFVNQGNGADFLYGKLLRQYSNSITYSMNRVGVPGFAEVPNYRIIYLANSKPTLYTIQSVVSNNFKNGTGVLRIKNSVTQFGQWLRGTTVTQVYVPTSITSIDSNAFTGCSSLTDIYVSFGPSEVSGAPWGATNAIIHYNYMDIYDYVTVNVYDEPTATLTLNNTASEESGTITIN